MSKQQEQPYQNDLSSRSLAEGNRIRGQRQNLFSPNTFERFTLNIPAHFLGNVILQSETCNLATYNRHLGANSKLLRNLST